MSLWLRLSVQHFFNIPTDLWYSNVDPDPLLWESPGFGSTWRLWIWIQEVQIRRKYTKKGPKTRRKNIAFKFADPGSTSLVWQISCCFYARYRLPRELSARRGHRWTSCPGHSGFPHYWGEQMLIFFIFWNLAAIKIYTYLFLNLLPVH